MFAQQKTIWAYLAFSILLVLSVLAGCGPSPQPTPTATPTSAPIALALDVNPNVKEIEAGTTVAIVARVSTGEEASLTWSVEGTSGGELSSETGDAVFYTAGDPGADIVTAEGTIADGTPVKERVSFNVVAPPTDTPVPPTDTPVPPTDTPVPPTDTPVPPTDTPVPPTDTPVSPTDTPAPPTDTPEPPKAECPFVSPIRIPIEDPSVDVEVSITSMENCADNLPTGSSVPLGGTYSGDLTNKEIWILVYASDLKYYPQSKDACASVSTLFTGGQWAETIILGRSGVPEAFHIVAVVTDIGSPASEAFHNYLTVGCTSGNYHGLTLVPPGATELDSIVVHTR